MDNEALDKKNILLDDKPLNQNDILLDDKPLDQNDILFNDEPLDILFEVLNNSDLNDDINEEQNFIYKLNALIKFKLLVIKNNIIIPIQSKIISNKFIMQISSIGEGHHGQVYKAMNVFRNENVALKFEQYHFSREFHLEKEYKLYKWWFGDTSGVGIPKIYSYFKNGHHMVLEMELLGQNFSTLLTQCKGKFTLSTVLQIGLQLLSSIEFIHSKGFIIRSLNPANVVIGLDSKTVYLIDFGRTISYCDLKTNMHKRYREGIPKIIGHEDFTSIATQKGILQSRRDDLEALGYILIFFVEGTLPWSSMNSWNKRERKRVTSLDELCNSLPDAFKSYMINVKHIKFQEKPDYEYLRGLFRATYEINFSSPLPFDWEQNDRE